MRKGNLFCLSAYFYIMEVNFSSLKQKDVINVIDGKNMGRVCDLSFSFPENCVLGFTVTGCKGFKFSKQEVFIPIKNVTKIGKDAVLVKFGENPTDRRPRPSAVARRLVLPRITARRRARPTIARPETIRRRDMTGEATTSTNKRSA